MAHAAFNRPVLLIDGMNAFLRHYAANPALNANGAHVGGIIGFLGSLRHLSERLSPSRIIVSWEGEGGSSRRRKLHPGYKQGRRPVKPNRFYDTEDMPDTSENKTWQLLKLGTLLKNVNVTQVYVRDCEADDLIACMCRGRLREDSKVIVSSDRDFYQLLNDNTAIYSLNRKLLVFAEDVKREFSTSAANFALAKAVCGDGSDCIDGVKGVGFKTLTKKVPELVSDERMSLDELVEACAARSTRANDACGKIAANVDLLRRNLQLVDLSEGWMIGATHLAKLEGAIDTSPSGPDKMGLMRGLFDEGITGFNVDALFLALKCLAR